jgi:hypothetical protein
MASFTITAPLPPQQMYLTMRQVLDGKVQHETPTGRIDATIRDFGTYQISAELLVPADPDLPSKLYVEAHGGDKMEAGCKRVLEKLAKSFAKSAPTKAGITWEDVEWAGDDWESRPQVICQHCQVKGRVAVKTESQKQGVSGGKATGALLTGGISLLATGLSRAGDVTSAKCRNCGMTWYLKG